MAENREHDPKQTKDLLPGPSAKTDINFPAILKAGAALLVTGVIIQIAMVWMFDYFNWREKRSDPKLSPLVTNQKQLPPGPRLQVTPMKDLKEIQSVDETYLNTYTWVDEQHGVVRIPIEQAMKKVVQQERNKTSPVKAKENEKK